MSESGALRVGRSDADATEKDAPTKKGRKKQSQLLEAPAEKPVQWTHSGPRLGELLLQRELISQDDLAAALVRQEESGVRIGAALVELGALDEKSLVLALAQQRGIEVVDLRREAPDPEALAALPESVARGLGALPLRRDDDGFAIVVADPNRPGLEAELERAVGGNIRLLLAPPSDVRRAIDRAYKALAGVAEHIRHFELTATAARPRQSPGSSPKPSERTRQS